MEAHPTLFEKSRDEAAFRQASIEIAALRERAEAGEIEVAYVDEAGFATVHPNRSAWTPRGEQHRIEARRGKRFNVLGALCSSGEFISARLWCCVNADLFVGFLGLLKERIAKPLTVILDNASIHKAKVTRPIVEHLKKQGVHLYFLPPYSPELNRIECVWHKMKHTWMEVKHRTEKMLEADICHILDNFGSKFKFAF